MGHPNIWARKSCEMLDFVFDLIFDFIPSLLFDCFAHWIYTREPRKQERSKGTGLV